MSLRELSRQSHKQECWNWQTGQTKDLVVAKSCGFKSHLLHIKIPEILKDFRDFLILEYFLY